MTIIANPLYDAVFTFMMEDKKVAKILLSALLKKDIVDLETRRHEYTRMERTRISLFRIDFFAKVREADGSEHLILIELQKTWRITETLHFRQYLANQYLDKHYLDKENLVEEKNHLGQKCTDDGLPIVSIYILGHALGDLTEPVIYVRRRYLDYDDPILLPTDRVLLPTDRFIESLPHDSIIVQIPFLTGRTRNRLERLLTVFDQENCRRNREHYLEIDDEHLDEEVQCVVYRLIKAAVAPTVRRAMEIEDELFSEIEDRDTTIMMQNQKIEELDQKKKELEQKEQEIEQQRMKKVDMTYSFHSTEEPTDEQLKQLMHEACREAVAKKQAAEKQYFEQLNEAAKLAKENFKKQYGKA